LAAGFLVVCVAGALAWNYLRPYPAATAALQLPVALTVSGTAPSLPWPRVGAGAVGVSGLGAIASSGNEQTLPAASVTKVMTALIVLADKPLAAGESGPSIRITNIDVQAYETDLAQDQSVVRVQAGERLSEYQALEAMLIPSGNNVAETLARWDAGSISAFVAKMNARGQSLGLTHTRFADPAGADTATVSTPSDLMKLGMDAMKLPALAQIVGLPSAVLPVAGAVFNVDTALGKDGIVGIKTGSGFKLGANFLFAATVPISNHPVTIFGCVMGQPTLAAAFDEARALVRAMAPALTVKQILARNQLVATYQTAWGDQTDVLSTVDVMVVEWPEMIMRNRLDTPNLVVSRPVAAGADAGRLHVVLGDYSLDVPLVTASAIFPPTKMWRLARLPGSG
jgi:D-alanyl-D-alanine carboxypeptidase (penicillin-binding protein 5/6)